MLESQDYLGSIMLWPSTEVPTNWMLCDGRILRPLDYKPLFALLGITFGGDGREGFGLPDMRGQVPLGNKSYDVGKTGGTATVQLTESNLPLHRHSKTVTVKQNASTSRGTTDEATKHYPALTESEMIYSPAEGNTMLGYWLDGTIKDAGQAHPKEISLLQPYLTLNFIICVNGAYPPRPE